MSCVPSPLLQKKKPTYFVMNFFLECSREAFLLPNQPFFCAYWFRNQILILIWHFSHKKYLWTDTIHYSENFLKIIIKFNRSKQWIDRNILIKIIRNDDMNFSVFIDFEENFMLLLYFILIYINIIKWSVFVQLEF